MKLLGRILRLIVLVPLTLAGALFGQTNTINEQLTRATWRMPLDTVVLARLWTYDTTCAKVAPLPGHDWRNVTWRAASLIDDGNLGEWTPGDTIYIDTSVVLSSTPAFVHRIFAHEMLHQLLQMRNVYDSATAREFPDSIHPFVVFTLRCDIPGGVGSPVVDVLGEQDDVGATRRRVVYVPWLIDRSAWPRPSQ